MGYQPSYLRFVCCDSKALFYRQSTIQWKKVNYLGNKNHIFTLLPKKEKIGHTLKMVNNKPTQYILHNNY